MTHSFLAMRLSLLLSTILLAAPLAAQPLEFGAAIPSSVEGVTDASGQPASLGAVQGTAGTAVLFWSEACAWTEKYRNRVADLAAELDTRGIAVVLVDSDDPNAIPAPLTADAAAPRSTLAGATLLLDPSHALADAFGARQAPSAFLFSRDGLVYRGAIDDSPADADRITIRYLMQAAEDLLAGQETEIQQTQAFGCTIKRRR